MNARNTIILAAGKGTRMKSKLHKVLHPVSGKAMVDHVLSQVEQLNMNNIITVVGFGAEKVKSVLKNRTKFVLQKKQLGTGDAVLSAAHILDKVNGTTLVVNGDTPLLTAKTLENLLKYHEQNKATATVLTSVTNDPKGYGRIIRNNLGMVEKIVEQKDATIQQRANKEVNTGVYVFNNKDLFKALRQINNNNSQSEFYLTDVIEILKKQGGKISAYKMSSFNESMGINDRLALAKANKIMQKRINVEHMKNGVNIIDPDNTYIDSGVKIGEDTVIEPGTHLQGNTIIGKESLVGANSKVINSNIHNRVKVISSTVENSEMMDNSSIGPYSHLRPESIIGPSVHLGNFVEIKKSKIGEGTKIGHLTYVGNAELGKHINVGCGVVFVNYDGKSKHTSKVGDEVFIGSNSNLVAPLNISDHSFIAAGSTITDDIKRYDMGIARKHQTNKPGYYKKLLSLDNKYKKE